MSTNIFEQSARDKLRFPSVKGRLSVEDLWDLPLTSKGGFDLDSVAKAVNRELKASAEESFVTVDSNPAKNTNETQLEILKHIIAVKLETKDKAEREIELKAEKQKLLALLANKQDAKLGELTEEELKAKIDALG